MNSKRKMNSKRTGGGGKERYKANEAGYRMSKRDKKSVHSVCPSVRPSVRPSICQSVRPSRSVPSSLPIHPPPCGLCCQPKLASLRLPRSGSSCVCLFPPAFSNEPRLGLTIIYKSWMHRDTSAGPSLFSTSSRPAPAPRGVRGEMFRNSPSLPPPTPFSHPVTNSRCLRVGPP